jgi:putative transposase
MQLKCNLFKAVSEAVMEYRRAKTPGATYFFTVITYNRRNILCTPDNIALLRQAFRSVITDHPFKIEAIVILPDHLHTLWTLPTGDADFSTRWRLIKSNFSRHCDIGDPGPISVSRRRRQEKPVWQRRFWEHQIRDEQDYIQHVEYIHYNPVKHGLVEAPIDWKHSSFRRYVEAGLYPADWGAGGSFSFAEHIGHE